MDFSRAITYIFNEPNWVKKILLTGLISVIPFFGFIYLIGWIAEIVERVRTNSYFLLPEMFSISYFIEGLKLALTGLIYCVPYFVISMIIRAVDWAWVRIFNGFLENAGSSFLVFINSAVGFIYFFCFLFIIPCVLFIYLERRNIRDTLQFKRIYLTIKNDPKTFLYLLLALVLCLIVASFGISVFYIGVIFTIPFGAAIYSYLVGQTAKSY